MQQLGADTLRELGTLLVIAGGAGGLTLGLAPGPAIAFPLLLTWTAGIVAVAAVRTAAAAQGVPVVAGNDGPAPTTARMPPPQLAALVGGSVVVALLAVLIVPRSDGLDAARSALAATGVGVGAPIGGSRVAQAYAGGVLDMRARGTLPQTPVAAVADGSPLLWRTSVLGRYDGTAWFPAPGAAPAAVGPDGKVPDLLGSLAGEPSDAAVRGDEVLVLEGFGGVLLAPGHAVRVDLPAGAYVTDGAAILTDGLLEPDDTYGVSTRVQTTVEQAASRPELAPRDGVDPSAV